MIDAIRLALASPSNHLLNSVESSNIRFKFMLDRFLVAMNFLSITEVKNMVPPLPKNSHTFALSLPETISRRNIFESLRPKECVVFDGVRRRPGWVGCGLSYSLLAKHAIDNNLEYITVMEDDVLLPSEYSSSLNKINKYLKQNHGSWDIFVGVIANLHPDTEVIAVDYFDGYTFVTINKMTSMVFNIYAQSALKILSLWNPENIDVDHNTIDRYLEGQQNLRVITIFPFLFGHREEVYSTLWGFKNSQYIDLINQSEALLKQKIDDFLMKSIS